MVRGLCISSLCSRSHFTDLMSYLFKPGSAVSEEPIRTNRMSGLDEMGVRAELVICADRLTKRNQRFCANRIRSCSNTVRIGEVSAARTGNVVMVSCP
jgi:hypothetical protein